MKDVIDTMKTLEGHLDQMKESGQIKGYEVELKDSDPDTATWAVWTW